MAHPKGEAGFGALRLDFDRRLKLEFLGLFGAPGKAFVSGSRPNGACTCFGGSVMRIIIAFAVLAVTVAFAGCFHHRQQVYVADIPPPISTPPYK
jgi:hypothetical protein